MSDQAVDQYGYRDAEPEGPNLARDEAWSRLLGELVHVLSRSRAERQDGVRQRLALLDGLESALVEFHAQRYGLSLGYAQRAARQDALWRPIAADRARYAPGKSQGDWHLNALARSLGEAVPWEVAADVILNLDGLDLTKPAHRARLDRLALHVVCGLDGRDVCAARGRGRPGDLLTGYLDAGKLPRREWDVDTEGYPAGRHRLAGALEKRAKRARQRGDNFEAIGG